MDKRKLHTKLSNTAECEKYLDDFVKHCEKEIDDRHLYVKLKYGDGDAEWVNLWGAVYEYKKKKRKVQKGAKGA